MTRLLCRRADGDEPGTLDPAVASAIDAERSSGTGVPDPVRGEMERFLGFDLSPVRVHVGAQADALSRAVGAEAFTTGRDVFFRTGRYDPVGTAGQELLAHELTHVAQQSTTEVGGSGVSRPTDPAELAASAAGSSFVDGHGLDAELPSGAAAVHRQEAVSGGGPGDNRCFNLLQDLIFFLDELRRRISDAEVDANQLFRFYKKIRDAHPTYGSWEGHRQRFYEERDELRRRLAEWDSDDDCRGTPLSPEQEQELTDAREVAEREFPERPVQLTRDAAPVEEPSLRDRIADALRRAGVPAWAVAAVVVLVIAAIADPEPFSKVAAIIGAVAAIAFFALIGLGDEAPSTASADQSSPGQNPTPPV